MKEVAFIKQNAPRWEELEKAIGSKRSIMPDDLSDLYLSLQDDLSYARTFYPRSNTTQYLNELIGHFHRAIYKNKKERAGRFITFWKYEVPYAVLKSHRQMVFALIVFLLSVLVGLVSAAHDEDFVRLILGDSYVNMTLDNIDKGDPMAVYKSAGEATSFFKIGPNNIKVSFIEYVGGITLSAVTIFILFTNGLMVGALQYLFYQKGVLVTSMLAIYLHGTLELSAIVITGGAGFVFGNSILFPGTYSRIDSVVEGALRGLKIVVGLVPVLLVADFIESVVTRHYDTMAMPLRIGIVVVSMTFIIWYFIIYPLQLKNRKNGEKDAVV